MCRQDAVQINVPRIAAPSAERLVNLMSHFYQDTVSEIKAYVHTPPISPSSKLECKLGLMISSRYAPFLREHTAHFRQLEKRFCNYNRPESKWTLVHSLGSAVMTRPSIIVINWESPPAPFFQSTFWFPAPSSFNAFTMVAPYGVMGQAYQDYRLVNGV